MAIGVNPPDQERGAVRAGAVKSVAARSTA